MRKNSSMKKIISSKSNKLSLGKGPSSLGGNATSLGNNELS
jgi:hypothetical protein